MRILYSVFWTSSFLIPPLCSSQIHPYLPTPPNFMPSFYKKHYLKYFFHKGVTAVQLGIVTKPLSHLYLESSFPQILLRNEAFTGWIQEVGWKFRVVHYSFHLCLTFTHIVVATFWFLWKGRFLTYFHSLVTLSGSRNISLQHDKLVCVLKELV